MGGVEKEKGDRCVMAGEKLPRLRHPAAHALDCRRARQRLFGERFRSLVRPLYSSIRGGRTFGGIGPAGGDGWRKGRRADAGGRGAARVRGRNTEGRRSE